jgi:hypothetical protein
MAGDPEIYKYKYLGLIVRERNEVEYRGGVMF